MLYYVVKNVNIKTSNVILQRLFYSNAVPRHIRVNKGLSLKFLGKILSLYADRGAVSNIFCYRLPFSLTQGAGSIKRNYCLPNLECNEVPTSVLIHVILTAKLTALVTS